jgi:capsular polysaccharide biosynthesis protein
LAGANISDRLGGDLSQIRHLEDVSEQIAELITCNISEFSKPPQIQEISDVQASRPRRIGRLKTCAVDVRSGLIVLESGFVVDGALPHWQQLLYQGGFAHEYYRARQTKKTISGTYIAIPAAKYFYHFVIEDLANIAWAIERYSACKVLIHDSSPKWQLDILDSLKIPYLITNLESARVENLIFVTSPRLLIRSDILKIQSLNKMSRDQNHNLSLYITRGDKDRGDSSLERMLVEYFSSRNFKIVSPDDISFSEQREIFSKANKVVSMHGGALTNTVWCKEGTKVLEIFNHPFRTYDYAKLSAEAGLDYNSINLDSSLPAKFTSEELISLLPQAFLENDE